MGKTSVKEVAGYEELLDAEDGNRIEGETEEIEEVGVSDEHFEVEDGIFSIYAKDVNKITASMSRKKASERNECIEANLKLVLFVARRYIGKGLPFLDLIQEGNIGLMRAVEKYDSARGVKFSVYAIWWIRQAIEMAISQKARVIRIPVETDEMLGKIIKSEKKLRQELKREPNVDEVAERLETPVEKIIHIIKSTRETISLETPIGDDGDSSIYDFIGDKRSIDPIEKMQMDDLGKAAKEVLSTLTKREEMVIRLRFGFEDCEEKTLEEIGKRLGVTRERIRQIEIGAIEKLKLPRRRRLLEAFAEM